MKPRRSTRQHALACVLLPLVLGLAPALRAQVVTWTGLAGPYDDYTNNTSNWQGNTLPLNNGTEHFVFGQSPDNTVYFASTINAYKVSIIGITSPFLLDDDNYALNLGAGGFVYAPAAPVTSFIGTYSLNLLADQTWDIQSGEVGFYYSYTIEGTGRVTKIGAGTLSLTTPSSWTGGLTLNGGRLALDAYDSTTWTLGSGSLIIGPPPGGLLTPTIVTRASNGYDYPVTVTNAVELNGILATENSVALHLSGPVTLNTNTTLAPAGDFLFVDGAIAEAGGARKLTVDGPGRVVLTGTNTYTGGTHVANGVLIFGTTGSLPATPATNALTTATGGYIGFGDDGTGNAGASLTNPQGLFLDRFNKASAFGTVGFDTDPSLPTLNFTGPVDLTGFAASAKLGSATRASLSGAITPQGASYRFGGGGGFMQVESVLTGARSLVLDSPAARPLTLRLTNGLNNYSGGTSVANSALIFGADGTNGTFPGGAGSVTVNGGGYVGFEGWGDQSVQDFIDNSLSNINPASVGAVGFEQVGTLGGNINLTGYTGSLYIATTTPGYVDEGFGSGVRLIGTITPAGGAAAPFRFAGYKGGQLEINSLLTGTNGIHIGDPNSPATFGDPLQEEYSTVALTGDNSGLSGNIIFYAGQLGVGQSNGVVGNDPTTALGSGNLVVQGMTLPAEWNDPDGEAPRLKLVADSNGTIIANNVVLNADLEVGGAADLKLTGNLSGNGELYVGDDGNNNFTLTLSGSNAGFTGGLYLSHNATLNLNSNDAAGTGPIGFGNANDAYIYFNTTAPVIGSLVSNTPDDYATLTANLSDTILTVNQTINSSFNGEFRSDATYPDDRFKILKTGTGTLRLNDGGMYFYHGVAGTGLPGDPQVSLQVNQGTVVFGSGFYVENSTPTFWVHGGNLVLDYAELYNPIVVDNGGRLAGNGYVGANTDIGTGATLSPGMLTNTPAAIGSLNFSHLALLGGGTMEWDIMQANVAANAWDKIFVYSAATLDLAGINLADPADAAHRFTLKVISRQLSGAQGLLADFNPSLSYSWLIFDTEGIAAFDPAKVIIDTSLFANSLDAGAGNGWFSLSQSGNTLLLNFNPVPEPSTYALILAGVVLAGLSRRRRRDG